MLEEDNPEGDFRLLWERESGVDYDVDHAVVKGENYWIVTHNATGPNFEVGYTKADGELPALRDLPALLPHKETTRIEGVDTCLLYTSPSPRDD